MSFSERETSATREFEDEIDDAPTKPGIYIFWSMATECLYIGKSTNIRQRLRRHLKSYRQCEYFRNDVEYDDPEMKEYAVKQFADQLIHAHMDEVSTVTTMPISLDGLRESTEEKLIRSLLPKYNEEYNHIKSDDALKLSCPECGRQLQYMKTVGGSGGYGCKNSGCRHYWELNNGDVAEVLSD